MNRSAVYLMAGLIIWLFSCSQGNRDQKSKYPLRLDIDFEDPVGAVYKGRDYKDVF